MSVAPISLALMVSFVSAVTIFGVSAENYAYGTQIVVIYLANALATPASLYLYLPVFFKLNKISIYEVNVNAKTYEFSQMLIK